ncbi:MAG: zinc-ribbon domain-containing protein [Chitinispirillaceae bacterium]|nr:zinc-ribbon domain-containing protein [Chitinispirillaceae bacterium]
MKSKDKILCSFCGEEIDKNARACPYCGSDDKTGWSDMTYLDGIDLGDDFDYEEVKRKEFPSKKRFPFTLLQLITLLVLLLIPLVFLIRLLF